MRALIRAARGGDDVPADERRRLLEAFARQHAAGEVTRAAGEGRRAGRGSVLPDGRRRSVVRRLGWASEEREAILALCDCRSQRGSARGERFLRERPRSLLAERVRRDCGLRANPVPTPEEPDTH